MMLTKKEFIFEKNRLLGLMHSDIKNAQSDLNAYASYMAPKAEKLTKLQLLLEYGEFFGQDEFFGTGGIEECESYASMYIDEYISHISTHTLNKAFLWVTEQYYNLGLYNYVRWITAAREIANHIHAKTWNEKAKRELYSYFMIRTPWAFDDYKKINELEYKAESYSDEHHLATCLTIRPKNDNSTSLIKIGTELGIIIPQSILESLDLKNGDSVIIETSNESITVKPKNIAI